MQPQHLIVNLSDSSSSDDSDGKRSVDRIQALSNANKNCRKRKSYYPSLLDQELSALDVQSRDFDLWDRKAKERGEEMDAKRQRLSATKNVLN